MIVVGQHLFSDCRSIPEFGLHAEVFAYFNLDLRLGVMASQMQLSDSGFGRGVTYTMIDSFRAKAV